LKTYIDQFFIDGYQQFNEPGLELHKDIVSFIGNKYLSPVFPSWKLIEVSYSEKVLLEDRITVWHNDSKFGMNITFLYYIDEMNPNIGGSISISNGNHEVVFYPIHGTLIMLSQKQNMLHKVEYTTMQRRMYNIDYLVEGY
jgi:hypothetical protein